MNEGFTVALSHYLYVRRSKELERSDSNSIERVMRALYTQVHALLSTSYATERYMCALLLHTIFFLLYVHNSSITIMGGRNYLPQKGCQPFSGGDFYLILLYIPVLLCRTLSWLIHDPCMII